MATLVGMTVPDTQTVGGFTDIHYPVAEPSWQRWSDEREDTFQVVANAKPAWVEPVVDRLNQLSLLPEDWDPRGSRPLAEEDVEAAVDFLNAVMNYRSPAPTISPLPSGGLELAWNVGNIELEVVFDSAGGERTALLAIGGEEQEVPPDDLANYVDFLGNELLVTG
jgi:hypothetical protein